jgi:hypothetical protein
MVLGLSLLYHDASINPLRKPPKRVEYVVARMDYDQASR